MCDPKKKFLLLCGLTRQLIESLDLMMKQDADFVFVRYDVLLVLFRCHHQNELNHSKPRLGL